MRMKPTGFKNLIAINNGNIIKIPNMILRKSRFYSNLFILS